MSVLDSDLEDQFEERVSFISSIDSSLLVYRTSYTDDQYEFNYKEVSNVLSKFNILTEELVNRGTERTKMFPILNPAEGTDEIAVNVQLHIHYIGNIDISARVVGLYEENNIKWVVERSYLMFEQELYANSGGIGCYRDEKSKNIIMHIKSRIEELLGKPTREYHDSKVSFYDLH